MTAVTALADLHYAISETRLVPWRSSYDGLSGGSAAAAGATVRMFFGEARPILVRAVSVVNIQLIRAPLALRSRSQAVISRLSFSRVSMRRSRHWPFSTRIAISTMLSQLACLGV